MRKCLFISGLLILIFTWGGPLPSLSHEVFYAHMTMHMLIVAVAAPILAIAVSGSKFDPAIKHEWLFAPIPVSVAELIIVWGWHAPGPHHFARQEVMGLMAEQGMFLLAGIWLWLSCLSSGRQGAGVIGLLLTSMHMTLLGALIGLAPRSLYAHHHSLTDQQLGGAIMLVVGGVVYLSGGVWLTSKIIRQQKRRMESNESLA